MIPLILPQDRLQILGDEWAHVSRCPLEDYCRTTCMASATLEWILEYSLAGCRKMMKRTCLALLFLLCSAFAFGFDFEGGSIQVPEGFVGPLQVDREQASFIGFRHPHEDATGALLQITIVRADGPVPELTDKDLRRGALQYLAQFLKGVADHRTDFKSEEPVIVSISGIPAARVSWSGTLSGVPMQGVMYCLIHGANIYSLHTQDVVSYGARYVDQATRAIESMRMTTAVHAD